jgi:hypothetical protein
MPILFLLPIIFCHSQFLNLIFLGVGNERGTEEAERWLTHQHRVYSSRRSPVEGYPSKRPGTFSCLHTWIDTGEWSRGEILLGGKILPE